MIVTVVQTNGDEVVSYIVGDNDPDATVESVADFVREVIADRTSFELQTSTDSFVVFPYEQIRRIEVRP